jgi:hypothetical protein
MIWSSVISVSADLLEIVMAPGDPITLITLCIREESDAQGRSIRASHAT